MSSAASQNTNRYTFKISQYHSIREASIDLNGITVLAGLNSCGKSTIARWLYAFIRFSNEFDEIQDEKTADEIITAIGNLDKIQRNLKVLTKIDREVAIHWSMDSLDHLVNTYRKAIDSLCGMIAMIPEDQLKPREEWLWKALGISNYAELTKERLLEKFKEQSLLQIEKLLNHGEEIKCAKEWSQLQEEIVNRLRLRHKAPSDMDLIENGTGLIVDDKFLPPLSLIRAIYIDSPMSVTNQIHYGNPCWDSLIGMLKFPLKPVDEGGKAIAYLIKRIIGGEVEVREDLAVRQELRYHRKKDNLDIPIEDVATGMKSFAYILRLLENGYLDNQTLLVIDEPEAHLHPQWIVKFARILVLLHTRLGVKIMVASHNPDMVAAIQAIGLAEGMDKTLNFYQAIPEEDGLSYRYESTGTSIGPIFDCFNIALDRIDTYRPQE